MQQSRFLRIFAHRRFPVWFISIAAAMLLSIVPEALAAFDSRNLSSALRDHGSVMLLIEPDSGRIVDANEAAARFYGYSIPDLRTMKIQDFNRLGPDEVAKERARAKREERSYFIFPHRVADGSLRTVEVRSSPVQLSDGRTALFSVIQDVTGRALIEDELLAYKRHLEELVDKRTHQVLEANEDRKILAVSALLAQAVVIALLIGVLRSRRRLQHATQRTNTLLLDERGKLRTLIEAMPDLVWMKDVHGVYRACNPQVQSLLGSSETEIIGQTDEAFVDRRTAERIQRDDVRAIAAGKSVVDEAWYMFASDGRRRLLETIRVPITDHAGSVCGVLGVARDMTSRKEAEGRLELAASVFAHAHEGIVIADVAGTIIDVNDAFCRVTGYAREEAIGKNPRILKSGRQSPDFYVEFWRALKTDGHWQGELWNRRKNGEIYAALLTVSAVREASGKVRHYVGLFSDITATLVEHHRQLDRAAHYDALTGLPNRTLLHDRLQQVIDAARREKCEAALLLLNVDRLQRVNDGLGHNIGDCLLRALGQRLHALMKSGDTVARLGGDEFAIVLAHVADAEETTATTQRILDEVARPYRIDDRELSVTASIGISVYPGDGDSAGELLKGADTAMAHAKDAERNSFRFVTAQMNEQVQRWVAIEHQLRHALERGELLLHYQPQVSLSTGRICGVEALLRWSSPQLGQVSPADFIPVAEDTGLILSIGEWVIRAACAQNCAWQQAGVGMVRIAVNVSACQLVDGSLPGIVRSALDATGLEPRYLELELTESVLMEERSTTWAQLGELKNMGVSISLDDFGTGYSSLRYLARLALDKIKIDQGFVRHITNDPRSAAIAHATIGLGRGLGLSVIAEGVETEGQMQYLRSAGCDAFQGYLFSHPLPAAEMAALMARTDLLMLRAAQDDSSRILLLLDDEPNVLHALVRVLRRDGYRILTAHCAAEAYELLAAHPVCVVISDQRMPDVNGTEFLSRVSKLHPDTVRIMLSGYTDLNSVTEAVNRGAIYKFMTKPWDDDILRQTVREAFLRHEDGQRRRQVSEALHA